MSAPVRGCFVTGTDTDAGKTVVAAAIAAGLRAGGARVRALKPLLTGLDDPREGSWPHDHEVLAAASGAGDPATVALRTFGPPVSPHLAAELAGVTVDLDELTAEILAAPAPGEFLIVEGIGGLLVPLAPGLGPPPARGRARPAGDRRRPPRARHDQPHAADTRGRPRRRAERARRRADAVAPGAWRDRALQRRHDRGARLRRGRSASVHRSSGSRQPGACGCQAAARPLAGPGAQLSVLAGGVVFVGGDAGVVIDTVPVDVVLVDVVPVDVVEVLVVEEAFDAPAETVTIVALAAGAVS